MADRHLTADTPFQSLRDHFLIAMPELTGSTFAGSVIYLCEHTPEGAMGLIINTPLDIPITQIFEQLAIEPEVGMSSGQVLFGGPVSVDHGFILHTNCNQAWEATRHITDQVSLTTSRDIIVDIAQGRGPLNALMILGYAGWGEGQLEQELLANDWLTVPSEPRLLFEVPRTQCARLAAEQAGIDLNRLASLSGHA